MHNLSVFFKDGHRFTYILKSKNVPKHLMHLFERFQYAHGPSYHLSVMRVVLISYTLYPFQLVVTLVSTFQSCYLFNLI